MRYIKTYEENTTPIIKYWENGNKKTENHYFNDKLHREDGPAIQYWYENGNKQSEEYYINDKTHRKDGPAYQEWYENGDKRFEYYYLNGRLHSDSSPAIQIWDENGDKQSEYYYINNQEYTIVEWLSKLKEIKSKNYDEQLKKYNKKRDLEKADFYKNINEYLETSYYMNDRNRKVVTKFDVGDFVKYRNDIYKIIKHWVEYQVGDTIYEMENIETGEINRGWGKEVKKVFTKKDLEKIDFYKNVKNYNL